MSQLINGNVYTKGVEDTLKNALCVALIDDNNTPVAISACINNGETTIGSLEKNYFLEKRVDWNQGTKEITIKDFNYEETKSLITDDVKKTATSFVLVKLIDEDLKNEKVELVEAYPNARQKYYFSTNIFEILENKQPQIILAGNLTNEVSVEKDNNFYFNKVNIKFLEEQII